MRRIILLATVALLMTAMVALLGAGTVAAHPHEAENSPEEQVIANGQNHPTFTHDTTTKLSTACDTEQTPGDPAYYGLESAHHGPDDGDPGKDEGCYAAVDDTPDDNPAPDDTNPGIQ
jgi:hypothetical protein